MIEEKRIYTIDHLQKNEVSALCKYISYKTIYDFITNCHLSVISDSKYIDINQLSYSSKKGQAAIVDYIIHYYYYYCSPSLKQFIIQQIDNLVSPIEKEYRKVNIQHDYFDFVYAIYNSPMKYNHMLYCRISGRQYTKEEKSIMQSIMLRIKFIVENKGITDYRTIKLMYNDSKLAQENRERLKQGLEKDKDISITNICLQEKNIKSKIKTLIISRAVWAEFEKREITNKSWQTLKEFLDNLPLDDLIAEVSNSCNCTIKEAKTHIEEFIKNAEKYIDSSDLDTNCLIAAIENHSELFNRCVGIVEDKWKADNSDKIENARHELEEVTSTISKKNAEIGDLNILIEKKQAEAAEIESVISRKQQLAQEIETKVAEKIKAARENAADFISEMTFGGIPAVGIEKESIIIQSRDEISAVSEYANFKDMCELLSVNIEGLGVKEDQAINLAYLMYSAYLNRIPLLFAGPNAAAFGDAFSVSMFGEYSAHVSCLWEFKENYVAPICGCERKIITFGNILHDKWLNRMVEIMNSSGKYFFFTTPFYEDLSVEPSSSLNYYIPIFTDLLIDEKAKDYHFEGGRAADSFKHFEIKKAKKSSYSDLLKQLKLSPYVRAIYNQQIANVTNMLKDDEPEEMIMIMLLSAAFLAGKTEIVSKYVSDHILNNEFEELVKDFIGEQE